MIIINWIFEYYRLAPLNQSQTIIKKLYKSSPPSLQNMNKIKAKNKM